MELAGLKEGDDYRTVNHGGEIAISIDKKSLPKLLEVSNKIANDDKELMDIKAHRSVPDNTRDFVVEGMADFITPEKDQIAIVQSVESNSTDHKVLAKASVGMGKTITAGILACRLKSKGVKPGWYILPTNLLTTTLTELREKFPGLTVEAAHADLHPDVANSADRKKLYSRENKPDILLVGQDSLRLDQDAINSLPDEHRPGFIIGDEIQAMFTPGEGNEKQSQRSQAMKGVTADYMLAMTGTPIRRSSSEVWRVLDWLKPGKYGSLSNWTLRYGKIGKGVSAFSEAVVDDFRQEINDSTITESRTPKVTLTQIPEKIQLNPDQVQRYRDIEEAYKRDSLKPGADKRKMAAQKVGRQRDVIYGSVNNAMLDKLRQDVAIDSSNGTRGVIHCVSLKSVKAVASSYPEGMIIPYTGDDDIRRRSAIISAVNDSTIISGARVGVLNQDKDGVVTKINGQKATVRMDDGTVFDEQLFNLKSKVIAVCGTSTAMGVLSTGLNLQRGSTWTLEYELADSAATRTQRLARNYRTGQTRDVTARTYIPDTPNTREHWHRLQQQQKLLDAFDDPVEAS